MPTQPDVVEVGKVLATLDDWRAITYVLIFIIVVLIVERAWTGWRQQAERSKMWELAARFDASAALVAEALSGVRQEIAVLRAVSSRIESKGSEGGQG